MLITKLIFSFILTLIFIKLIIKNAKVLGLVDIPNDRSSHTKITPRGAGIGFGLSFFLYFLVFDFSFFIEYWTVFLAIFLVFLIGILDDHKDASPKQKFYVIFVSSIILYFSDISIDSLGLFFGFEFYLWYFALPFSMFAFAGYTNALNLIDGLDGLAGLVSLIILSTFVYIGYKYDDELILSISSVVIVTLLAFLYFNWNPAKIFMGDSGSLFLGFIIALLGILSIKYVHPIAVLYIIAIPILDTVIVMIRRIRYGKSPFKPDKTHIHHILLKFFSKNVKKTVFFISLMQGLFSLLGIVLASNSKELGNGAGSFMALVGFFGITVLFYMIFTGMKRRQKLIEKLALRKKRKHKLNNQKS